MAPNNLVPFSLRIPPQLEARIEYLAGRARMSPRAFVRNLLEDATSEKPATTPPTPASTPATPPKSALTDDALRRLAHAILFTEMAAEAALPDPDDAPLLRETAEQRVSDLLGKEAGNQRHAPPWAGAAERDEHVQQKERGGMA